jgi:hypothetical protein
MVLREDSRAGLEPQAHGRTMHLHRTGPVHMEALVLELVSAPEESRFRMIEQQ